MNDEKKALADAWDHGYQAALDNHTELSDRARHIRNRHGTDTWEAWVNLPEQDQHEWLKEKHYAMVADTPMTAAHVRVCLLDTLKTQRIGDTK